MRKIAAISFVIVATAAGSHPAFAQNGFALVQEHCSTCHAIGASVKSPHSGAPPLSRISEFYNLDEFADLLETGRLLAPHPDMPAFKFGRPAAIAITNYLRSIQN